jgi:hypothetical protein
MRILFVTSTRLGDAVLSTGLLDHLLRAHPEARFTIAWQSSNVPSTATQATLSSTAVVMNRRWTVLIRPSGNITATFTNTSTASSIATNTTTTTATITLIITPTATATNATNLSSSHLAQGVAASAQKQHGG